MTFLADAFKMQLPERRSSQCELHTKRWPMSLKVGNRFGIGWEF